jgi:CheY-like chemotaxis protein
MAKRPAILVADDSVVHTQSLKDAFARLDSGIQIKIVRDGAEAMNYLVRDPAKDFFDEFPTPIVLLLDLYMANMNGFEVLNWVRTQSEYRKLPVIVLSGSSKMADARRAYELGANGYLVKPFSDRDYLSLAVCVKRFLLNVKELNCFSVLPAVHGSNTRTR